MNPYILTYFEVEVYHSQLWQEKYVNDAIQTDKEIPEDTQVLYKEINILGSWNIKNSDKKQVLETFLFCIEDKALHFQNLHFDSC